MAVKTKVRSSERSAKRARTIPVRRRASPRSRPQRVMGVGLLALIVFVVFIALCAGYARLHALDAQIEQLEKELLSLEAEQALLEEQASALADPARVSRIAQEAGMVRAGESSPYLVVLAPEGTSEVPANVVVTDRRDGISRTSH